MERIVEGTYLTMKEVREAIERLEEDNYSVDEMMVITDKEKQYDETQIASYAVNIDSVEVSEEEESFWDKIKETLSFDQYSSNDSDSLLTEFGVNEERAEHFNEALEAGEIILLVDSNAPKKIDELSSVNEEVMDGEFPGSEETVQLSHAGKVHSTKEENAYETVDQSSDQVEKNQTMPETKETDVSQLETGDFDASQAENTRKEEEKAKEKKGTEKRDTTDKKPTEISTSETSDQAMDEDMDPSQAQHTRDEKNDAVKEETKPDLTGDEKTVVKDEQPHHYPKNINTSVINRKEKE
ncbi:general stress protein [Lacticigenium naphthae]|uniref:general stress protein n=1 Tax=Lacticigenium naphthae TaxID=515351 RepID=UPI00040E0C55|nr:general stress protein [Lacticigenium naphthae]